MSLERSSSTPLNGRATQLCNRESESKPIAHVVVGSGSAHRESSSRDATGLKARSEHSVALAHEFVAVTRKQIGTVEGEERAGSDDVDVVLGPHEIEREIYKNHWVSIEQEDYHAEALFPPTRSLSNLSILGPCLQLPASCATSQVNQEEPRVNTLSMTHALGHERVMEVNGSKSHQIPPVQSLPASSFEKIRSVSPDNIPGPAKYHRFYWNCMELKSELIRLDFSLRSVGSGGPGVQATHLVKLALRRLRDLYGTNTSALFPRDINVKMYSPTGSRAYLTDFSLVFNDFGVALDELARALHDFNTVYHDESLMLQLFSLHSRFKAEATAISLRKDYRSPSDELSAKIQAMLEEWVEDAITSLTDAVRTFHEKGVPAIQNAQNNTLSRYLNMTTIAFFLSGTTASMLQISANDTTSPLGVAANTYLFTSLVFSVGSAVNSLLVSGWRKSIVRDPDETLPMWLRIWLNAGPMISLLTAGAFFAVGLCLFVFSTGQHAATSAIIVVFSSIHASGLLFLFGYFIQERWKFRKDAGSLGRDLTKDSLTLSILEWARNCLVSLKRTQISEGHFGAAQAESGRKLGTNLSAQALRSEKDHGSETAPLNSRAVWHALSDETFLLNSRFVFNDDTANELQGRENASEPSVNRWNWEDDSVPSLVSFPRPPMSPSNDSVELTDSRPFDGGDASIMTDAFRRALRRPDFDDHPSKEPALLRSRSFPPHHMQTEMRQLALSKPNLSGQQADVSMARRSRSHPSYITRAELDSGAGARLGRTDYTRPEAHAQSGQRTYQSLLTTSIPLAVNRDASEVSSISTSSGRYAHTSPENIVVSERAESPSQSALDEELYLPGVKEENCYAAMAHHCELLEESADEETHSPALDVPYHEVAEARHGQSQECIISLTPEHEEVQSRRSRRTESDANSLDDAYRIRRIRVDPISIPDTPEMAPMSNNSDDAGPSDHPAPRHRWNRYNTPHSRYATNSRFGNVQAAALFLPNSSRFRVPHTETPPRPR